MKPNDPEYLKPYLREIDVVMEELSEVKEGWWYVVDHLDQMWADPARYPLFSFVRLDTSDRSKGLTDCCGCLTLLKTPSNDLDALGFDGEPDHDLTLTVRAIEGIPTGMYIEDLEEVGVTDLPSVRKMLHIFANAQAAIDEMRTNHETN